jgi:hypothetical protein
MCAKDTNIQENNVKSEDDPQRTRNAEIFSLDKATGLVHNTSRKIQLAQFIIFTYWSFHLDI